MDAAQQPAAAAHAAGAELRQLFGGAVVAALPSTFVVRTATACATRARGALTAPAARQDVSTLRQVPDNQEVWADSRVRGTRRHRGAAAVGRADMRDGAAPAGWPDETWRAQHFARCANRRMCFALALLVEAAVVLGHAPVVLRLLCAACARDGVPESRRAMRSVASRARSPRATKSRLAATFYPGRRALTHARQAAPRTVSAAAVSGA
jgi:hypothetical protein